MDTHGLITPRPQQFLLSEFKPEILDLILSFAHHDQGIDGERAYSDQREDHKTEVQKELMAIMRQQNKPIEEICAEAKAYLDVEKAKAMAEDRNRYMTFCIFDAILNYVQCPNDIEYMYNGKMEHFCAKKSQATTMEERYNELFSRRNLDSYVRRYDEEFRHAKGEAWNKSMGTYVPWCQVDRLYHRGWHIPWVEVLSGYKYTNAHRCIMTSYGEELLVPPTAPYYRPYYFGETGLTNVGGVQYPTERDALAAMIIYDVINEGQYYGMMDDDESNSFDGTIETTTFAAAMIGVRLGVGVQAEVLDGMSLVSNGTEETMLSEEEITLDDWSPPVQELNVNDPIGTWLMEEGGDLDSYYNRDRTWRLATSAEMDRLENNNAFSMDGSSSYEYDGDNEISTASTDYFSDTTSNPSNFEFLLAAVERPLRLQFPDNHAILQSPNVWIADTGASNHTSFTQQGGINIRPSAQKIRGITGKANAATTCFDAPCTHTDKYGEEICQVKLRGVTYIPDSNFNLCSLSKLLNSGWEMSGTEDKIVMTKGDTSLEFDIKISTHEGAIFCGCFKRCVDVNDDENNMANIMAGGVASEKSMPIAETHALLGHKNELATRRIAEQLGWKISRGVLKPCESCTNTKAKQKNVPKKSSGMKATEPDGKWYQDIATIRAKKGSGITVQYPNWQIIVDEFTGLKRSGFHASKSGIIESTCEKISKCKEAGRPVQILRQDNAGENKKLAKRLRSSAWKCSDTKIEFTAKETPQQNALAELGFTHMAGMARAMMNHANVPAEARYKLFPDAVNTAVMLDYLTVVEINGVSKTRIEHYGLTIPNWSKHLHKWGEAGTVKTGKDGKIGDRGVTMMFIGYANNHEGNVFRMWNKKTSRVSETRDVTSCNECITKRLIKLLSCYLRYTSRMSSLIKRIQMRISLMLTLKRGG